MKQNIYLIERLNGYNTPDRTLDNQKQVAQDINDAKNYIINLEERINELELLEKDWRKSCDYINALNKEEEINQRLKIQIKDLNEVIEMKSNYYNEALERFFGDETTFYEYNKQLEDENVKLKEDFDAATESIKNLVNYNNKLDNEIREKKQIIKSLMEEMDKDQKDCEFLHDKITNLEDDLNYNNLIVKSIETIVLNNGKPSDICLTIPVVREVYRLYQLTYFDRDINNFKSRN